MSGVRGPSWAQSFQFEPEQGAQAAGGESQQLGEAKDQEAIQGASKRPVRTAEDSGQKVAGQVKDLLAQGDIRSINQRLERLIAGVSEASVESPAKQKHAQRKVDAFVVAAQKDGTLAELRKQAGNRSSDSENKAATLSLRKKLESLGSTVQDGGSPAAKQALQKR